MKKRVLLLSTTTGYQTRAFDAAAKDLGVELVYGLDQCRGLDNPWVDHSVAVRFYDDPRSLDALVRANADSPLHGILALGDRPTALAAQAAEALGLSFHPPDAARASRNKLQTRERLRAAGLPVPAHATLSVDDDPLSVVRRWSPGPDPRSPSFPVVLKPLVLSGSRGVIRADTPGEFIDAFLRIRHILDAPDVRLMKDPDSRLILVESFIEGREFAVEGLMIDGTFGGLAIFDKPDPLDGPYFEETIYVTPSREEAGAQSEILAGIEAATRAIGLRHGPVHAECRVNPRGVYTLEAAARPIGGLCARALRFSSIGTSVMSFETLLLKHAMGEDVTAISREDAASGVMMVPIPRAGIYRGVEGLDEVRRTPLVEDVIITAVPDQHLVPLPDGASYLGFIFARGETSDAVVDALGTAHGRLRFRIDRELPLAAALPNPESRIPNPG